MASLTGSKCKLADEEDILERFWRFYNRLQKRSRSEEYNQRLKRRIDEVRLERSGQAKRATSDRREVPGSASDNDDYPDQANGHKPVKDTDKEREDAKALLSAVQDLASCIENLYLMRDVPFYRIQALKDKDMEFFFEPEMRVLETGLKKPVIKLAKEDYSHLYGTFSIDLRSGEGDVREAHLMYKESENSGWRPKTAMPATGSTNAIALLELAKSFRDHINWRVSKGIYR